MFIDSHAHIFDEKIDISNANLDDICKIIVPSFNQCTMQKALDICKQNAKFLCALGIYPEFCEEYNKDIENFIIQNLHNIVCIGEIGLDTRFPNFEKQIEVFEKQIILAQKYNLPASIHLIGNQSFDTFFSIVENLKVKCALHCFSGDINNAMKAIQGGHYISFACNITYKGNQNLRNIAKEIPLDNILIETDSPSMLPAIFQRKGVNTPQNIHYVAEVLAQVKNTTVDNIANITTLNAKKLFNIKDTI